MADPPAGNGTAAKKGGTFGFLSRKMGPLPVWAWAAIGFGAYYWYTHYGPGAKIQQQGKGKGSRARVIVRSFGGGGRGPRGPRGAPGPPGNPGGGGPGDEDDKIEDNPRWDRRSDATNPDTSGKGGGGPGRGGGGDRGAAPVTAAAPMTATDIHGSIPTASPSGRIYDSGTGSPSYIWADLPRSYAASLPEGSYVPPS